MRRALFILPCLMLTSTAFADDIDTLNALSQAQFRAFSEDLAAVVSYKAVAPAEPLGVSGFDLGVEATNTRLENSGAFAAACGGCDADSLVMPKLHLHKGLPASLDIGLMLGAVPGSNIRVSGLELRYAILDGGVAAPALAVRADFSRLSGVDQLSLQTHGVELTVSKGFTLLTPYAGIGRNWVSSRPSSSTGLQDESFHQDKVFAGVNLNFGLTNLALEVDRTGDTESFSAKLGFRF